MTPYLSHYRNILLSFLVWCQSLDNEEMKRKGGEWSRAVLLQGVVVGGALGCALPMWISIGAYVTKPPVMRNLPRSVAGCFNASALTTASLMSTLDPFTSQPITLAPSSYVDSACGLP